MSLDHLRLLVVENDVLQVVLLTPGGSATAVVDEGSHPGRLRYIEKWIPMHAKAGRLAPLPKQIL